MSAGGIYTYSIGILKEILKSDKIKKVVIITSQEITNRLDEFKTNPKIKLRVVDRNNFIIKLRYLVSYLLFNTIAAFGNYSGENKFVHAFVKFSNWINPYRKVLLSENLSLFHVPVQYSPIYQCEVPVIITMHDLQEYHYPEFFSSKELKHRLVNNNKAMMMSNHIIVSFNHVKADILKYFKVPDDKISVCPPPFAENWFISKNETGWDELSSKYGLKKNYLLYPAVTWKHKNHIRLLQALKKLRENSINIDLVCTGNKTDYFKIIEVEIEKNQLSDAVNFLGIVPEADLIGLYKNSSLVAIPTLYEAGSGPLYEAMRYRAPVICSDVTSLPETIGSSEFIFDPNNIDAMVNKIKEGLSDEEFRKRNVQNSISRMETFKQTNYHENFLNSYKKILN